MSKKKKKRKKQASKKHRLTLDELHDELDTLNDDLVSIVDWDDPIQDAIDTVDGIATRIHDLLNDFIGMSRLQRNVLKSIYDDLDKSTRHLARGQAGVETAKVAVEDIYSDVGDEISERDEED
jgi:hypothetical protein